MSSVLSKGIPQDRRKRTNMSETTHSGFVVPKSFLMNTILLSYTLHYKLITT